jgi:hypothetical protein
MSRPAVEDVGALAHPTARGPVNVRSIALHFLFGVAVVTSLGGCTPPAKGPTGPTRPLSAWSGEEAQLFGDTIDAGALPPGVQQPSRDEENEAKIPRRLDLADGVVGAKIIGLSAESRAERNIYRLELAIEGEPYAGKGIESPFSIIAEPETTTYSAVKSGGNGIIGRKVVVFFKRYAAPEEGDVPITHYHIAPLTPAVLKAIETAKTRKQFD